MAAIVAGEWNARDWFRASRKRRSSLLIWENSGGRFNGYGSVNGQRAILATLVGLWGSGAIPAYTGVSSGWGGVTEGWYTDGTIGTPGDPGVIWGINGAPAFFDAYCPGLTAGTEIPNRYMYLQAGALTAYIGAQASLIINSDHAFYGGASPTIRHHYTYGKFEAAGSGLMRPSVAQSVNNIADHGSNISTSGAAADAIVDGSFDFTHAVSPSAYSLHVARIDQNIRGPVILFYRQLTKPSITSGVAVTLGLSLGGRSNRAQAIAAGATDTQPTIPAVYDNRTGMSLTQLKELLRQAVLGQVLSGLRPMLLVRLNEGLNARNELYASVGPLAIADGDSPEAYLDNNEAIKIRMRLAWTGLGYDLADLMFLETIDHPLNPDDAEMITFETAIMDAAAASEDSMAVAVRQLVTGAQLTSGGYYDGGGQPHLTNAGYDYKEAAIWRAAFQSARGGPKRTRARTRARAAGRSARS